MNALNRLLASTCLVGSSLLAQATPNTPPAPQTRALLLSNATLHTVSGPVLLQARMLVLNGRIAAIGGAELLEPAGALTLDLQGKHVYPGLVAANTTVGLVEVNSVRATVDSTEVGSVNPNARALVAFNADSERIPVTRSGGVLAALTLPRSSATGLVAGTSALMQLEGWNWGDMALRPEVGLHISLPSLRALPSDPFDADSVVDMRGTVRARLRQLDEVFESAAAYAKARAADPGNTPLDSRWEALLPVLRGERPVFANADERGQIRHALALAERFKLKLVIVGGADAASLADTLRERQVPVIIAALNRLPLRRDDDVDAIFRLPAELARAGVRFAIARNAADGSNERNLAFEAGQAVAHGLDPAEALKAVTLYPAQLLSAADLIGSLEVGKLANFFVADGDPLDIRTRVERLFVQGREIEMRDRHTDLRDKYQQRYGR